MNAALDAHGAIDIVVNNAGATKRGDFFELTDADWADGFALKFMGAVRLTRAAWPHLKARRGSVLNIIGAGGRTPSAEFTIGGSVNGACLSFTKAVADIGIQDGVQVNAINPGRVKTDRFQQTLADEAAASWRRFGRRPASDRSQIKYRPAGRTRGHCEPCGVHGVAAIALHAGRADRSRRRPDENNLRLSEALRIAGGAHVAPAFRRALWNQAHAPPEGGRYTNQSDVLTQTLRSGAFDL